MLKNEGRTLSAEEIYQGAWNRPMTGNAGALWKCTSRRKITDNNKWKKRETDKNGSFVFSALFSNIHWIHRKEGNDMELNTASAGQSLRLLHQEGAARNERFVAECLKKIRAAPDAESLRQSAPLIYEILAQQEIRSIILSPLLSQGKMAGLLGADNPPPEKMEHISVLFNVLACFVCALVSQRELQKLREARDTLNRPGTAAAARFMDKTVLLNALARRQDLVYRPHADCPPSMFPRFVPSPPEFL